MTTSRVVIISGIVLILSILMEVLFVHHHVHYWWHGFIGFDIIYGFVGCVAIIVVSKGLGKLFVQRQENYWEGGEERHD